MNENENGNATMKSGKGHKFSKQIRTTFFKPPEPDLKYTLGNFISGESGVSSLDEPVREFKLFSLDNCELNDVENKFIDKLTKFAAACLNSRTNGTMYFGVADTKDGDHKHGEIVGMNVPEHQSYVIEEWIDKHLRGTSPKCLKHCDLQAIKAFSKCILPIKVIRIENCERIIVEVDVKPDADICKYFVFPVSFPTGNDNKPKYYDRDETSSTPGNLSSMVI